MTVFLHFKGGSKLLSTQSKKEREVGKKKETLEYITKLLRMASRGKNPYNVGVPEMET